MFERLKFWLYDRLLTFPSDNEQIRWFRFGIPLVMKRSQFPQSTETEALRFLHSTQLNLPIPRVIDSFTLGGDAYTIMTRLPGDNLLNLHRRGAVTDEQTRAIINEVHAVVRKLWTLAPPPQYEGLVMCHPTGGGLPFFKWDMEDTIGPLPMDELYAELTLSMALHSPWTGKDIKLLEPERMKSIMSDKIVYVHGDLRIQNIMVTPDGKFSGIIDWENSGWHARHWQILFVRTPYGCINPHKVANIWKSIEFEREAEEAYEACLWLIRERD